MTTVPNGIGVLSRCSVNTPTLPYVSNFIGLSLCQYECTITIYNITLLAGHGTSFFWQCHQGKQVIVPSHNLYSSHLDVHVATYRSEIHVDFHILRKSLYMGGKTGCEYGRRTLEAVSLLKTVATFNCI